MRTAFKEWAVVVEALGGGDQIIILRKGGLREGPGGFAVEHAEFWLFPTRFHQGSESIVASAHFRLTRLAAPPVAAAAVRLEFLAEVVAWHRLDSITAAAPLRGQHIWTDEVIRQRFEGGAERKIYALAVRVRRLPSPVVLPALPSYEGCKSWIELADEVPTAGARPVLDDAALAAKLERFHAALESAVTAS